MCVQVFVTCALSLVPCALCLVTCDLCLAMSNPYDAGAVSKLATASASLS